MKGLPLSDEKHEEVFALGMSRSGAVSQTLLKRYESFKKSIFTHSVGFEDTSAPCCSTYLSVFRQK